MSSKAEEALENLERLALREPSGEPSFPRIRAIPPDLATDDHETLLLDAQEVRALEIAQAALLADQRFEYLDKKLDDLVWRFFCTATIAPFEGLTAAFVAEHARSIESRTCYFPIEALSVSSRVEVFGISLLPVSDPEIPPAELGFSLESPVGAVAALPVEGTHLGRMKDRALPVLRRALRVLRIALRAHRTIPDEQLRFRISDGFSFGKHLTGWQMRADAAWDLDLDQELVEFAAAQPVRALAEDPTDGVRRQAQLALRWIEDAALATDPLAELLFQFFALEALLGVKSEGLKAHGLAFRRAMLGVATEGRFTDPGRAYWLYDAVRSSAVHGGEPPELDADLVRRFGWDARRALSQYLTLAERESLVSRKAVLRYLKRHPERDKLISWLAENGGAAWEPFLQELSDESEASLGESKSEED